MIETLVTRLHNFYLRLIGADWEMRDRFDHDIIDSDLYQALMSLEIVAENRAATERLPATRPAVQHFGRRDRVQHSIGRS